MRIDRSVLPAVILTVGVLLSFGVKNQHSVDLRAPLSTLPSSLGSSTGVDLPISEIERTVGGASEYLFRSFTGGAQPFSVYVGYYARQARGQTIHSPRNCLPGDGWEALTTGTIVVSAPGSPTVNRVVLAKEGRRAVVYYWYQGRGRVVANEYMVKWNLLRDAALSRRTEEALARVVVMLAEPGVAATGPAVARADSAAMTAVQALIPALKQVLPAPASVSREVAQLGG